MLLLCYLLFIIKIVSIETTLRVLDKGLLPVEKKSVAIQFYLDIENEDKLNACKLRSKPKVCCLSDNEDMHCDIMEIYGDYHNILKPKYRDTVLFIYPTIVQHDLVGYCSFFIEHSCGRDKSKREIKIPFDTRLKNKSQYLLKGYDDGKQISSCVTLDQDSTKQCSPVNCDAKYSGNRPFYDVEIDKCVKAVECLSDPKLDLPDVVYEPTSNTCKDLNNPLTVADIYAISTGLGIIVGLPKIEEVKVTLQSNCSTISENLLFLKDLLYGKIFSTQLKADFSKSCSTAILSILTCIVGLSLALLFCVVFTNITVWAYKKWCNGEIKKKFQDFTNKIKPQRKKCNKKVSRVNDEVKSKLLKEVIVSDLPLELRDSVVDICERIGKEVKWKRRYRMGDVGSHVNLEETNTGDTSSTSDPD